MKTTPSQVEKAEKKLDGCPWCNVKPRILVQDEEGNPKGFFDSDCAIEYLDDTWSGLSFGLYHDYKTKGAEHCPIANHPGEHLGSYSYNTLAALVRAWNKRKAKK